MYHGVSGRQARTSKDCHPQGPNQQPAASRSPRRQADSDDL